MSDGGWSEFTKGMNMAQIARAAELAEERDYDRLIRNQRHEATTGEPVVPRVVTQLPTEVVQRGPGFYTRLVVVPVREGETTSEALAAAGGGDE